MDTAPVPLRQARRDVPAPAPEADEADGDGGAGARVMRRSDATHGTPPAPRPWPCLVPYSAADPRGSETLTRTRARIDPD